MEHAYAQCTDHCFLMLINVFFPLCLVSIFNHSFTSRILQLSKVFKSVDSEKLVSMTDRESKDEIGSMIKITTDGKSHK